MSNQTELLQALREIQMRFPAFHSRILNHLDLTLPQYALLSLLEEGDLSMTEASCRLWITKPAVTNLVDRLEKSGRIKRYPHSKDRRVYLLRILPKGLDAVNFVRSQLLKIASTAIRELNPSEAKTVLRFYSLLSKTLDVAMASSDAACKKKGAR